MTNDIKDFSRLCIHSITTKPWNIEEAATRYAAAGVKGISVWRQHLEGRNPVVTGKMIRSKGIDIVSLVRGGFFASGDPEQRKQAVETNRKALAEASDLEAPLLVLVCGADPGQPLENSREQISEGINSLLPLAESLGVKMAIEPLHPMYADTRSAINTLAQANEMAEEIHSDWLGVAVDVYHLWWDPDLEQQIARCGRNGNLFAYHICDWNSPTVDMLNDRGLMGEGCIPLRKIRGWVEQAGFTGYHEVEIFSDKFWSGDQQAYLGKITNSYLMYS
jgi:sugar phosphate isomerase/epimerase